jgi:DNA-binding transcriptional LysR family regulator
MIDPRLDLRTLEAFYYTCTQGSQYKAGQTLHVVQTAIARRIAGLEQCIGGAVFDDSRRALTPLGERLFSHIERLLEQHRTMRAELSTPAALTGSLNLGVCETIVHTLLPHFLQRVAVRYPRLLLVLDVDESVHLKERLQDKQLDLAFLVAPVEDDDLHSLPLKREPMAFVASPRLGIAQPATVAAIAERHPFITFRSNTRPFRLLRELVKGARQTPLIHESASVAAMVKMAVYGIGVAVLPRVLVQPEIDRGELTALECEMSLPDLELGASWHFSPRVCHLEELAQIAQEVAALHPQAAAA